MPNNVENYLYIKFDKLQDMDEFENFLKEKREEYRQKSLIASDTPPRDDNHQLSPKQRYESISRSIMHAEFFVPMPEKEANNWYNWNTDNWGTKWGLYNIVDQGIYLINYHHYTFLSAWNPPRKVIKVMSKRFPKLSFRLEYFEYGSDTCGIDIYRNGVMSTFREGYHNSNGNKYFNFAYERGG